MHSRPSWFKSKICTETDISELSELSEPSWLPKFRNGTFRNFQNHLILKCIVLLPLVELLYFTFWSRGSEKSRFGTGRFCLQNWWFRKVLIRNFSNWPSKLTVPKSSDSELIYFVFKLVVLLQITTELIYFVFRTSGSEKFRFGTLKCCSYSSHVWNHIGMHDFALGIWKNEKFRNVPIQNSYILPLYI